MPTDSFVARRSARLLCACRRSVAQTHKAARGGQVSPLWPAQSLTTSAWFLQRFPAARPASWTLGYTVLCVRRMAAPSNDAVEVKLFGKWSFEEVEVRIWARAW